MATSFAVAQTPQTRPWEQEIRDASQSALVQTAVPGLWVVVVDGGQIVVSEALGTASTTGPTPLARQTVVRLAGPGELGINLALLRLSDMGKLDLDAPISRYVRVHPALGRVTANQLISHKAGLRAKHFTNPLWEDADLSREVQSWDERVFIAEPGETQSHSHYGIALGGYLVESLVGKPFPDAMRELVWVPMGVASGTTRIRDVLTSPIAQGHRSSNGVTDVIRPLGRGFIGWPNAPFLSLDGLDRFASALAEPATGGRVRGGSALTNSWTHSWSWAGIAFTAVVDVERRFCALIADNGGGPAQSRLAQTIKQVVLGQKPPAPPAVISWKPVSPSARESLIGVYENETTFEIAVRDGKLILQSGQSVEEVTQGAENLFQAPILIVEGTGIRSSTFVVEVSSEGKARRLRIGSRVWVRKPS
ncbi:MAG TPA: serine hydrolase domain-containing protein [Gemmatimonadaceae bacterium]|nr:serine hydrolase domain-containing protein [Gemmatimonadaceae bacterium]